MLRGLLTAARQLLLPAHCASCGSPSPPDRSLPLCEPCGRALAQLITTPFCPRCGRTAGPYAYNLDGCAACRGESVRYDAAVRVGPYQEPLRSLILRYKYQRRVEIADHLGRLLSERLALAPWADLVDLIVPVPLHWGRRISRGFNQAEMLARVLVRPLRAPARRVAKRRLLRVRPTPHQTRLPAADRQRNVRGAFEMRRAAELAGKRVLLVDDVMTSGSTVAECTRVLKKAGAGAVYVAVVATADYDDPGPW